MRRASAFLFVFLAACTTVQTRYAEPVLADRLFCGLTIPGGGVVSEAEWRAFLAEEVTPRFRDGFTIWLAEGQWRAPDGQIVREPSLVIEIIHRPDMRVEQDIVAVAEAYKTRFRQDAVMRVTMPARMELID